MTDLTERFPGMPISTASESHRLGRRLPLEARHLWRAAAALGGAAVVLVGIPWLADAFWIKVALSSVIYTLAASGTALLYARLGLVSLAQVALVGVGGWVMLRLSYLMPLPTEVNLVLTGILTGLVGVIVGLPALRTRGLYLALITLMAAGGFHIFVTAIQFPNGGPGFSGFAVSGARFLPRPVLAESDQAMFRYVVVVTVLSYLLIEAHRRSRAGRAWAFIRKSEATAMATGINVTLYKAWAFGLAGFLAGIAGGLLACVLGRLEASSFPASESIMLFALTVVGGAYSVLGQVLTGLLYRVVPQVFDALGIDGNLAYVIFGVGLLHAIITAPTGIAGQLIDALAALKARLMREPRP